MNALSLKSDPYGADGDWHRIKIHKSVSEDLADKLMMQLATENDFFVQRIKKSEFSPDGYIYQYFVVVRNPYWAECKINIINMLEENGCKCRVSF